MLVELSVRDLGVISELRLVLGPGMTAVTGETGAGKTLVVEAIELLLGGRADPVLVRPGADEAWVEGRFVDGEDEVVLARAIPAAGRSRAYVDGRMAPATALAERGAALVDLHGQHAHQSLLTTATQRAALDRFAGVDLEPLRAARAGLRDVEAAQAQLGGDGKARAREIDLLRFQVDELTAAGIDDPDEDAALETEEARLADVTAHREAAGAAVEALTGDDGTADLLGTAIGAVAGRAPFAELEQRLRAAAAEVADAAADLRHLGESLEDDPERLAEVRARRQLLHDLQRKYGDSLAEVAAYRDEAARRLAELQSFDARWAELEARRHDALATIAAAEAVVGSQRRAAAPKLGKAIQTNLRSLAMPKASVAVEVADADPGDDVAYLLAANPGSPLLPLAKVASGGELARAMLAARLVLRGGAPTLVFDEVDAGIGGEAAVAVGRSLAELADQHQVLVVTHLPQVAAFADQQVRISKDDDGRRTVASAEVLDAGSRVIELSRMLSGQPASETARQHAQELLASAAAERGR